MSFGKLGALGRGFGHLGAGGQAGAPRNTLRARAGSFILTGTDMTPKSAYVVPAALGTFALTGVAAALSTTAASTTTLGNPGTGIALSNGNLTATSSGGNANARSVSSYSTGKFYLEFTTGTPHANMGVGVLNAAFITTDFIGDNDSIAAGYGGGYIGNGVSGTTTCDSLQVTGHVYGVAVDVTNRAIWIKDLTAAGNWNANGTANPATNTNGASFAGNGQIGAGAVNFGVTVGNSGDNLTVNFGATAYTGTPPAGFGNW